MLSLEQIEKITNPFDLLRVDMLDDLAEEPEEERIRLSTALIIKANQLGIQKQFEQLFKAYTKALDKISADYTRENAKKRSAISLDFDANGRPLSSVDNFLQVLENDPKFAGLKFNELTYSPEKLVDGKMERWTDADDAEMRRYIEKKYRFHSVQKSDDALRIVMAENRYHPVRDIVGYIRWDGQSRIYDFLHTWTKCEDTPYTREVSRLIFAGGINRLYNPGCKFDDMPVLIGTKQGEGKSTLVRWLALEDEYFSEVNEFDGQRGIEAVEGAWICEVSELLAMTRVKEQEAVKSYLTRQNDRYRMPFDKRVTDHPRQCIFIGTTNKEQFLTDKTGNRRFYPVKVNQSGYELFEHKDEIKAYIRQCWAEALNLYFSGNLAPYADRSLVSQIRAAQDRAVEDDYRIGLIKEYLDFKDEVCIIQLWREALHSDPLKPTRKESQDISLIMQSFPDWEKQPNAKRMGEYGVQKYWKRVSGQAEEELPL